MENAPDPPIPAAQADTLPPALPSAAPPVHTFARPGPKIALAMGVVVAIILLTVVIPASAPGAKYTDVREITASPAAYDGKAVAVVGGVQSGSVSVGSRLAFNLTDYSDENVWMRVVYDGGMDANFGEGKKVLAEGVVHTEAGVAKLFATKISIGCPTDYRGATNATG